MNEIEWVERLHARFGFPPTADTVGIGDDACVLTLKQHESLVTTVDTVVDGVHFRSEWLSNGELAERAIRTSVSDLAAMAAEPRGILLAIETPELPGQLDDEFFDGIATACDEFGAPLLGGNVTRTTGPLSIAATALGAVTQGMAVLRSTARPGDDIYVSGSPGRASIVLRQLIDGGPLDERDRAFWARPQPRLSLARRLALADHLTAAIDLSDGLAMDLGRLLRASQVGASVDLESLEARSGIDLESMLQGGEDYELLFTVRPNRRSGIAKIAAEEGIDLTLIGTTLSRRTVAVRGRGGVWTGPTGGWDPFEADLTR